MRSSVIAPLALAILGAWTGVAAAQSATLQITSDDNKPINWRWLAAPDSTTVRVTLSENTSAAQVGAVKIGCEIAKNQHLGDCKVLDGPPTSGLGTVLIRLSASYKAASKDVDGASTIGRKVFFRYAPKG
jgi:hypothetical protein